MSPDRDTVAFLEALARALHAYGTPSHRTEDALVRVAERLGTRARYLVTPTSILSSYADDEGDRVRLSRVDAGEADLEKLRRLHQVIRAVFDGDLTPAAARARVEGIAAEAPLYPPALTAMGFALGSATAARFFDGGAAEMASAGILGLAVGLLVILTAERPHLVRLLPALAGLIAAAGAHAVTGPVALFTPISILASLIVLLPGLTLTVAMNEVALGHVVSGSARLTAAVGTFLQLGFGVAIGSRIGDALGGGAPVSPEPWPEWTILPALLLSSLSLTVLFRARWRDSALILPMATLAYLGSRWGSAFTSPEVGAALGALLLGGAANAVARWRDVPTALPLLPALLLLVPGSLGFHSLESLLANDVLGGVQAAFSMAMVAIGLVSGLLVANLVVLPRRLL